MEEQNFVQTVKSFVVLNIMKVYDGSGGDYIHCGLGDPMEPLDCIVYEVSGIVGNYFCSFIKFVLVARDRVTVIHCRTCGHVLKHHHWSGEEGSLFIKVYPSYENGWGIKKLIMNEMMKKSETLSGNVEFCECCKEHVRSVMLQDFFNTWEYDASDKQMNEF